MKAKGIWIGLAVLMILSLLGAAIGCSTEAPKPTPTQKPTSAPAPPSTPTPTATPKPTSTPAPTGVITLKVGSYGGKTYGLRIMIEEANKLIEQRSGGRIKISYYPEESLVKMVDVFEAAPAGVIDIMPTSPLYRVDLFGIIGTIQNVPFNWDENVFNQHYRDKGGFYDFIAPYYKKNGLYLLSWANVGGFELGAKTPIHSPDDLKGKLMRSAGGGFADGMRLLGVEPVFITPGEIYEAMQRRTVDGWSLGLSAARSLSLPEVSPYITIIGITTANLSFVMSEKRRQELPADLVKVIDDAFLEAERNSNAQVQGIVAADIEAIKKHPSVKEVYTIPDAERAKWETKVKPLFDQYAKKYGAEWDTFWKIRDSLIKK